MRQNEFQKARIPTCHFLTGKKKFVVRYIQGALRTPAGFSEVKDVLFQQNKITFIDVNGKRASTALRHEFVLQKQTPDPGGR